MSGGAADARRGIGRIAHANIELGGAAVALEGAERQRRRAEGSRQPDRSADPVLGEVEIGVGDAVLDDEGIGRYCTVAEAAECQCRVAQADSDV